uniref:Uncharacterized protein n=1 Tax=Tetradesmus obliquus TaxID=3088 RepID=A0A383VG61_TETOB|eukprot:jgi/Sobl393_1/3576/SZX63779.1
MAVQQLPDYELPDVTGQAVQQLPDYELPDVTGQAGEAGAAGAFLERIGKFAHEHGIIKPAEFYANDRDHWVD